MPHCTGLLCYKLVHGQLADYRVRRALLIAPFTTAGEKGGPVIYGIHTAARALLHQPDVTRGLSDLPVGENCPVGSTLPPVRPGDAGLVIRRRIAEDLRQPWVRDVSHDWKPPHSKIRCPVRRFR
ncbi:hypothetical protein GCM10017674_76130 [Streptomyces gardneri]|uniref:Uncharacterized protein n=1 Tax=Streptomyces gardneri TaxID=66892 RepID=A0A4Y3RW17_9ACTN|nr:hypothetical protein SGA01_57350 [Streptomyces gardneri]GHH21406.1 hypothetical protein GCM10017674_76130 [Streptomyces gardneri]